MPTVKAKPTNDDLIALLLKIRTGYGYRHPADIAERCRAAITAAKVANQHEAVNAMLATIRRNEVAP